MKFTKAEISDEQLGQLKVNLEAQYDPSNELERCCVVEMLESLRFFVRAAQPPPPVEMDEAGLRDLAAYFCWGP